MRRATGDGPPHERPRVALVLGSSTGGVGRHVASLAAHLAGREVAVGVFGPAATEQAFTFTAGGARFAPVEIEPGIRPLADARALLRLRGLLAGADLVHAHGLRAGVIAGLAGSRAIPLIVTWHNEILTGGAAGFVLRRMRSWLARRADLTLAVSPDLAQIARQRGAPDVRRALVVAPPFPPSDGATPEDVRTSLGLRPAQRLVVGIGRLHPQKRFDVLIEAAGLLDPRSQAGPAAPRVAVRIAGDGPMRLRLEGAAAKARADGADVRLLGHRDDVGRLLAAADVVAMPSTWEGWPLAAAEALRAGRPLVACAVGGLPELAGDAAVLVRPGDAEALAAALRRVLDDAAFAADLARRGRARAAAWPDETQVADAALHLYLDLISRRRT